MFLERLLFNASERFCRKYSETVKRISRLQVEYSTYCREELISLFNSWKGMNGEEVLVNVFALVKEVFIRVLNIKLFDVQLLAGIALAKENVAEVNTGEGKTFIACLPTIFYLTTYPYVHVITVNDYLTKRDYDVVSVVFDF